MNLDELNDDELRLLIIAAKVRCNWHVYDFCKAPDCRKRGDGEARCYAYDTVRALEELARYKAAAGEGDRKTRLPPAKWAGTRQRDDLKGCPFCGTAALQQMRLADSSTDMQHRIICGNPFCHVDLQAGPCAALKDAESFWEDRAP